MASSVQAVYFHGLPGSGAELRLFETPGTAGWDVAERQGWPAAGALASHFDLLARDVARRCAAGPVRLIGFSLGAYVALEVASRLPDAALTIDLISGAAPLGDGSVLQRMAGGAVFSLALRQPRLFAAMSRAQGWAARVTPGLVRDAMFRSARGEDRALRDDPAFRCGMGDILRDSLGGNCTTYVREIGGYVTDWSATVARVGQPVNLWHGREDNWTPPEMLETLIGALPRVASVHRLEGLSHYSTLRAYLRERAPG